LKDDGVLFHAKHAYMPNFLGYCGPDDRGRILEDLQDHRKDEALVSTLRQFEAAFPFLRLIARSTGRDVFDYSVPEAYWIGNGLLERVPKEDFYNFSHRELRGKDPREVRKAFKGAGRTAIPHHTFYVMSTYATSSVADGPSLSNTGAKKVTSLMDDCRISWGKVRRVDGKALLVEYSPVELVDGSIGFGKPRTKRVAYDSAVRPFGEVKKGDEVSMHWNFACEVLTERQVRNLSRFTSQDIDATNRILGSYSRRG